MKRGRIGAVDLKSIRSTFGGSGRTRMSLPNVPKAIGPCAHPRYSPAAYPFAPDMDH